MAAWQTTAVIHGVIEGIQGRVRKSRWLVVGYIFSLLGLFSDSIYYI
jgi:hypothetical protein